MAGFLLGDDSSDQICPFLVLVDVLRDQQHLRVSALEMRTVGMVPGRRREELVEKEGILEAPLDRLDEQRREVPGGRPAVRKICALREIRLESRVQLLQTQNRSVMSNAIPRGNLLDPGQRVEKDATDMVVRCRVLASGRVIERVRERLGESGDFFEVDEDRLDIGFLHQRLAQAIVRRLLRGCPLPVSALAMQTQTRPHDMVGDLRQV